LSERLISRQFDYLADALGYRVADKGDSVRALARWAVDTLA
jgi:hypothetical protein